MVLLIQPAAVPPISGLGPDPLLEPMRLDEFIESLSKKRKKFTIKALLLDQVKAVMLVSLAVAKTILLSNLCIMVII
jgi:formamidopyrimidine-DNA glycosylase